DVKRPQGGWVEVEHTDVLALPAAVWRMRRQRSPGGLDTLRIEIDGQQPLATQAHRRQREQTRPAPNIQERAPLDRFSPHQPNERVFGLLNPRFVDLLRVPRPVFAKLE